MRVRSLLIATAILSAALGAIAAYLVLTVPNDLQAGHLLKEARADVKSGNNEKARDALARIIQQYPRTDAAAAATVALIQLQDEERLAVQREVDRLKADNGIQKTSLANVAGAVAKLQSAPPPPPPVVQAPAAKPKAKAAPRRRTGRRR